MRGLSTYASSTVLAVNNPCACLCHLLGVHFVELEREKKGGRERMVTNT